MVMSKDKGKPDNSSSSDELSENGPSHLQKNTFIVIDSTGDSDDEFGNNLKTSEIIESDLVDNNKAGDQLEPSPGLNCDKATLEDLKCSDRENVNIINGFLESSPRRDKTFPVKYFDYKSQDSSKKVLKDCLVNCSMTEEEVEHRRKMLKSCDNSQPFGENMTDSIPKKTETMIESSLDEISSFTYEDRTDQNCNTRNCHNDKKTNIFCSTPLHKREIPDNSFNKETVFEEMSPLVQPLLKTKNLKRKNLKLESIQEADDDSSDSCSEKKIKLGNENAFKKKTIDLTVNVVDEADKDSSNSFLKKKIKLDNKNEFETEIIDLTINVVDDVSSMSHYEAPAKSILKKWQPSYVCRDSSGSSFNLDDEAAGHEEDDFEVACKSLTEELMKSSTNIDELGKESQVDDDKFDEIWKELNEELDGKTSLSLKTMEESVLSEGHGTVLSVKSMVLNDTNDGTLKNENSSTSSLNNTVVDKRLEVSTVKEMSNDEKVLQPRENTSCEKTDKKERSVTLIAKSTLNSDLDSPELIGKTAKKSPENPSKSSDQANKNDLEVDEEEILLEGDKNKPYHYVEYVSEDPQENEDNYNPEWQRLGRLTNDEERYKAVRDRWRSLVPPDPNKDLTLRQWREKNKLPRNSLNPANNNYQLIEDNNRTRQCTAVFDMKIDSIRAELDNTRKKFLFRRNKDFERLAKKQDEEQRHFIMTGGNNMQFSYLHKNQLEQCRNLKDMHDNKIRQLMAKAERKIKLLREGCNEVMLFQRFYKGVGQNGNDDDMMTNMQVNELVETEDMIETYELLYTG